MSNLEYIFGDERRIIITDGGFATTLETTFGANLNDTPLWSAKLIRDDPSTILQAHEAFLRAGADVLLTATYQASCETYEAAGIGSKEATGLMRRGIVLADEARRHVGRGNVKIALSLGPFGAACQPAREYDGIYPPPFGPPESSGRNFFSREEKDDEQRALKALTDFHARRLSIFASDARTWSRIDCVAFETIPLAREVAAVCRAMASVPESQRKPWWISVNFPDGEFPERRAADSRPLSAADVIRVATQEGAYPAPSGFGINCTRLEFLPRLVHEMEGALGDSKPWVVLYPNGGEVYDVTTKTWHAKSDSGARSQWARDLMKLGQDILKRGAWTGVLLGGCCRVLPEDIEALSELA